VNFSVIVGSNNSELVNLISHRLNHPAINMQITSVIADAAELAACLATTEPDLIILDSKLPKLSKSITKQIIKSFEVVVLISEESEAPWRINARKNYCELSELAKKLGHYKRENTQPLQDERSGELILVTSVVASSGATTIALNLGYFLSNSNSVMLADFDLLQPSLFAQISNTPSRHGLTTLIAQMNKINLTPAELAEHCQTITPGLRVLPGISSSHLVSELDLSALDELSDVAKDLDEKVIVDLGQLQVVGPIAKLQQELVSLSSRVVLVVAADPISILLTCDWLQSQHTIPSSKLNLVINKVNNRNDLVEIANLFQDSFKLTPQVLLPFDSELFIECIWSGEPAVIRKPKSSFSTTFLSWTSKSGKAPKDFSIEARGKKRTSRLSRLREAS
jgi:MinD-like ATPase involved in chromosome partitioning or flagellar assembly/CheY-like chemotaxis protein